MLLLLLLCKLPLLLMRHLPLVDLQLLVLQLLQLQQLPLLLLLLLGRELQVQVLLLRVEVLRRRGERVRGRRVGEVGVASRELRKKRPKRRVSMRRKYHAHLRGGHGGGRHHARATRKPDADRQLTPKAAVAVRGRQSL